MNKLAFLVPVYPPDFGYLKQLYNSYIHFNIYKQADLYFIFTNEEEKIYLGNYHYSLIYDTNLGVYRDGIINKKKFYGLQQLKDKYEYTIIIDCESVFIRELDIYNLCNIYFENKVLYGNKCVTEYMQLVNSIKNRCKRFFINNAQSYKLDTELYLWFNQLCIYKNSNLEQFFSIINYDKIIKNLKFEDFDYLIYMYYLILYNDFIIEDMEIITSFGACESASYDTIFLSDKYKKLNIYMCSNFMIKYFDNPNLLLTIQLDKIFDQNILKFENNINILQNEVNSTKYEYNNLQNEINSIKIKYDNLEKGLSGIINIYNNLINTLAWWIPIRKWRDSFRNKFFDKFIGGGVNNGFKFLYPLNFRLGLNY